MSSYFEEIPNELMELILTYLPVGSYNLIYEYRPFKRILNRPSFWRSMYYNRFTLIEFVIWNDFSDRDFNTYILDYIKLGQAYDKAEYYLSSVLNTGPKSPNRILLSVNLKYLKHIQFIIPNTSDKNSGDELKKRIINLWLNAYHGNEDIKLTLCWSEQFMILLESTGNLEYYALDKRNVFNLLVELIYNGIYFRTIS